MGKDRQTLTIYAQPEQDTVQPQAVMLPRLKRVKLSRGERLLRNSAIACALLLGLLSLRNIDHPWAQTASGAVQKALTMDFDVDETLGELQFVRRFLPESALVFWNIRDKDRLQKPVQGQMLHEYSAQQPWYTFVADNGDEVVCGKSGRLTGAVQSDTGDWALEIEHADGSNTVYAFVDRGVMEIGESIRQGEVLSHAALQGCVYLEYRVDGKSVHVEAFDG